MDRTEDQLPPNFGYSGEPAKDFEPKMLGAAVK